MDTERYQLIRDALQEAGRLEGDARRSHLEAVPADVTGEVQRLLGENVITGDRRVAVKILHPHVPHVHVDRDDHSAKFWPDPVTLARNHGFGAKELGRIERIVQRHAMEL